MCLCFVPNLTTGYWRYLQFGLLQRKMPDETFKASYLLPILDSCSNVAIQLIPFLVSLILEFSDIFIAC